MKKPIMFFVLAGFAAVLASMVVYSALKRKEAEVEQARVKTVQVAVAARDLPLGTKLDVAAVRMVRWPRDSIPAGASTDLQAFVGNVVKIAFVENEPLVASKLFVGEKTSGVLPLLIPAGMRAMSVPVDEVGDIAGFVLPQSRVDVLVALAGGGAEGNRAKIVLEDVEVLAVAQTIEQKQDEPKVVRVVTLVVTPEQAEQLTLATHEGSLRLAMRNYNDNKIVLTPGVDVAGVLHAYSNARPAPITPLQTMVRHAEYTVRPPTPVEVEVMRNGDSREAIEFVNNAALIHRGDNSIPPTLPPPAPPQESPPAAQPASAKPAESTFAPLMQPGPNLGPSAKTIDIP
ncbi:MAG TPA: Flp pilus assembly protein CpaB [Candidatus Binataceae bacterium]|nr:Flp pilus assembly protein CpaB [Candidatus Binataceae bacterium]